MIYEVSYVGISVALTSTIHKRKPRCHRTYMQRYWGYFYICDNNLYHMRYEATLIIQVNNPFCLVLDIFLLLLMSPSPRLTRGNYPKNMTVS